MCSHVWKNVFSGKKRGKNTILMSTENWFCILTMVKKQFIIKEKQQIYTQYYNV